jgi:hypothetical protein
MVMEREQPLSTIFGSKLPFAHDADVDLDYKQRPTVGRQRSRSGLAQLEYWHQAAVAKFGIIARQGQGNWSRTVAEEYKQEMKKLAAGQLFC